MNKAYISFYNSGRAIHLDVVRELCLEAFLQSFKRQKRNSNRSANRPRARSARLYQTYQNTSDVIFVLSCCLKKIVQNARLAYGEFLTILIEVGALNSHPLTYVYDDNLEPSTSQLVIGRRLLTNPNSFKTESNKFMTEG